MKIIFRRVHGRGKTQLYPKGSRLAGRVSRAIIVAEGYENAPIEIRHITINGLLDYYAGTDGRIYKQHIEASANYGAEDVYKVVEPNFSQDGRYLRVNVSTPRGERYLVEVHRLVASAFDTRGKLLRKGSIYEVHHIDFNSLNNTPTNLQILTKKQHAKLHKEHRQALIK